MLLSGPTIKSKIADGSIFIAPFDEAHLQPNSYDLTLAPELIEYASALDMRKEPVGQRRIIPSAGFWLHPGRFYLGVTQEAAGSQVFVPGIEGRSSTARYGLSVHAAAGFGDAGFVGHWTLELTVAVPLRVYAGARICQVFFDHLDHTEGPRPQYRGRYTELLANLPNPYPKPVPSRGWYDGQGLGAPQVTEDSHE